MHVVNSVVTTKKNSFSNSKIIERGEIRKIKIIIG